MARLVFQFKPEGLAVFKDVARTNLLETVPYESIGAVGSLSPTAIVIRGKTGWLLLFRDLTNYAVEWQKGLLMLKDVGAEVKDELKEVELTYFFEPLKLRFARSNYTFSYTSAEQ